MQIQRKMVSAEQHALESKVHAKSGDLAEMVGHCCMALVSPGDEILAG